MIPTGDVLKTFRKRRMEARGEGEEAGGKWQRQSLRTAGCQGSLFLCRSLLFAGLWEVGRETGSFQFCFTLKYDPAEAGESSPRSVFFFFQSSLGSHRTGRRAAN